jgi:hypothetical protein
MNLSREKGYNQEGTKHGRDTTLKATTWKDTTQ